MKVLHITADHKWTGPAEPMLHAIRALRERGHQADLLCPDPPPGLGPQLLDHALDRGITPVERMERGQGYRPWRDRHQVRRLRARLREGAYDIVHVHHTRDHLICRKAVRGLSTRLVVSWHRGDPIPRTPWSRWLFGRHGADGLIVLSERLAEAARRALHRPAHEIGVVAGVVDVDRFSPRLPSQDLREELGLVPGERVIGVVARLQPHRRFEMLLEAFRLAREQAPGLRLVVVGRGTRARQVLHEPVERMGLGDAVVAAGYRRGDYLEVLSCLDALVFLVPGSDGSCRAVLEAMAMGVPAVVSRRGMLPETVLDGVTGCVIDENAAALALALLDVWSRPARWQTLGKAARERATARHSIARMGERLERFYTDLSRRPDARR